MLIYVEKSIYAASDNKDILMIDWKIKDKGFKKENIAEYGNRFLIGNGYMGVRGTADEYEKSELVAINLSGIYDKAGEGWREPVNAPNGLFALVSIDDKIYSLLDTSPFYNEFSLNYKHGIFERTTEWTTDRGRFSFVSERLTSLSSVHTIANKITIKANFHADVKLQMGVDTDVWDINGPHYKNISTQFVGENIEQGTEIWTKAQTGEGDEVVLGEKIKCDFPVVEEHTEKDGKSLVNINFITDLNREYTIYRYIDIYTSKDSDNFEDECHKELKKSFEKGYELIREEHCRCWDDIWEDSYVEIEEFEDSHRDYVDNVIYNPTEAINYSTYHLNSIAPRHRDGLSIPARGLSGQTYKGAVFWDTEMFMMDFFIYTDPEVARRLVKYRINTLDGAKEKSKQYRYKGAFYAWESQEGGFDACSDYNVTDVFTKRPMRTYFKDKQIHISAAVVYAINKYIDVTGDDTILSEGGAKTIIECALFYLDYLKQKVGEDVYQLLDVIGPDEYHERVDNNGYTNRMAKFCFDTALNILDKKETLSDLDLDKEEVEDLKNKLADASEKIYIPKPNEDGIIPQFDGYFDLKDVSVDYVRSQLLDPKEYWGGAYGVASQTQVIKQADVMTWLAMFDNDFDKTIIDKNWQYYEPRTEHGSSLSACMYALSACKCDRQNEAYRLFLKSATADLTLGGKQWAGLVYIGGTHPAAEGGAYMVVISGFAGLSAKGGKILLEPNLPDNIKNIRFNVKVRDKRYKIYVSRDEQIVEEA